MEVGSLHYDLDIDDSKLKSQLDSADKSVSSFGDKVSQTWSKSVDASKAFTIGVAAAGAAVVAFGVSSVKAYEDSQTALAQLDAVLKSTGGSAGVTRASAIALSEEIQHTTSISHEAALAVENMGLTFTAIGKDIFPTATKSAIDMATALNHGMKPSAEQAADSMKLLGKALQDPDAGLGALHRVGVNVEQLKNEFTASMPIQEKQKLILQELGREFGGSAAAQAQTFSGRIDQLKNSFNDLQEGVGEVIVRALGPVANAFGDVVDRITKAGGLLKVMTDLWKQHREAIILVAVAIGGMMIPNLIEMAKTFAAFIIDLGPWGILAVALTIGIQKLVQHFGGWKKVMQDIKPILSDLYTIGHLFFDLFTGGDPTLKQNEMRFNGLAIVLTRIREVVMDIPNALKAVWQWFQALPPAVQIVISPLAFLIASFGLVKQIVMDVVNIFMTWFWPSIKSLSDAITSNLLPALLSIWTSVNRLWNALNPALIDALKIVGAILGVLLIGALWLFINVLRIAVEGIAFLANAIADVINWISNLISWFGTAVAATGSWVGGVLYWFSQLGTNIKAIINSIISWFAGMPASILLAIGNAISLLYKAGSDLVQGMINGITDKFKDLIGAVKNAVGSAVNGVKGFLGIHSPSTVFKEIGKNVTAGFVQGITSTAGLATAAMGTLANNVIAPNLTLAPATSATAGAASNIVNRGNVNVTLNMKGVMASGQNDLRLVGKKMIGAVNEELRARGAAEIGGGNV